MYKTKVSIKNQIRKTSSNIIEGLVKPMLIVNDDTSLWSVLVKFINSVFTKTLG